jgi:hypothetical protein
MIPIGYGAAPLNVFSRFDQIKIQAMRAYGDCNKMGHAVRNTNWRSSHTVSALQFVQLIEACIGPEGYNNFTIETAKLLAAAAPNARYTLAREGSVCVYIKASLAERVALSICDHGADEFGSGRVYGGLEPDGTLRLWWD